ncbi:MAG: 7,8-dihydroneopterin aldolase [Bacteroidia bacterium]|nr:MAG: 7,8-dihydroneopterin aldolase [Bacteroidia bacterium]
MLRAIEIKGIQCYAFHGCMPEEKKTGGKYLVDVIIHYDFEIAADTDDLKNTIDYCVIYNIVQEQMAVPTRLIETVAKKIAIVCKQKYPDIQKIFVKVYKLSPPINGLVEHVAVSYEL